MSDDKGLQDDEPIEWLRSFSVSLLLLPIAGWLAYATYARLSWDLPFTCYGWKVYVFWVAIVVTGHVLVTAENK
jgi:hypothetical protein